MKEVENVDYVSFGLVMGIVAAIFGLVVAILYFAGFASMLVDLFTAVLSGFGIAAIVIFPIVFFIVGLIGGIVAALLYNFFLNKYIKIQAE